jgi:hypothetical protein
MAEIRHASTHFGEPAILLELFEFMDLELQAASATQLPSARYEYVRLLAISTTRYMGDHGMSATMAQATTVASVLGHSMLMASMKGDKVRLVIYLYLLFVCVPAPFIVYMSP